MISTKKQGNISAAKFSVAISYPPLSSRLGKPFLSQNRQFQWSNTNNVIYPVIPAYAASLLQENGYQVLWDDAIVTNSTYTQWQRSIKKEKPNIIAIETKTPVIKKHWEIINKLKKILPKTIVVLMGDHVTALPKESLQKSKVDYILTGGDYDFMLLSLANHLSKGTKLDSGFYFRQNKKIINSGAFALKHHNLDQLPVIDRNLTQWYRYSKNNANYKYLPAAYTMFGRDCWWGKCTFCSWTTLFPGSAFRTLSVDNAIKEVENLVNNFGVREIFDDSGTFPVGPWLSKFCQQIIKKKLNKKVKISCNMRFGCLSDSQYRLMSQAGFRFILYGLESSSQDTLNKIDKNVKIEQIEKDLTLAKKYHLEPHITIMIGYLWENEKDIQNTITFSKSLFKKGLADSMQATIVIPYPGTPLFDYCKRKRLLKTLDWDKYDMRQSIMITSLSDSDLKNYVQKLFTASITPKFILNKILAIRSFKDIVFLSKSTYKYFLKLTDFS